MNRIVILAALMTLAGCDLEQHKQIIVEVYPNLEKCVIEQVPMPCADAGAHLRDKLSIAPDRQIDVSMYRMDKSHNPKDIERVAEFVRAAGYKDVKVWHFSFE